VILVLGISVGMLVAAAVWAVAGPWFDELARRWFE
jgi:hypothetical protein